MRPTDVGDAAALARLPDEQHNGPMVLYAGVDIGSATAKAVVIDVAGVAGAAGAAGAAGVAGTAGPVIVGKALRPVGYDIEAAGWAVLLEAREAAAPAGSTELPPLAGVIATGYGRHAFPGAGAAVTEITCHARGSVELVPGVRTVIDVGGQDFKVIAVGPQGRVLDFVMNDKCAAGTGRFLEVMARALEVPLDEFGPLSLQARAPAEVSNTCTVFAESEVISLRASRRPKEDIIAGIHKAMARRIAGLARRVELGPPIVMTGGAARNIGLVRAIETELAVELVVPELAPYAGALGAALLAMERA